MAVDQQHCADGVAVGGKARQMNLADGVQRQIADVAQRIAAVIDAGDVDVVHVEQQAATGAADHLGQEGSLVHRRAFKLEIGRRVLDQYLAPQALLYPVNVIADTVQRGTVVGHRQQVVEEHLAMAGPGQVFGE